ncbi:MAG: YbaN family protein [Pacificimonas sp.]|nr:YbaN family protein [Pacificimonas sp.]
MTEDEILATLPTRSPALRQVYLWLGWLNVGLGAIGAVLPVMPTVIFLIFAAACFARSNPRLEAKLLRHPVFGEHIIAWRERRAITKKGKWAASLGMIVGAAFGLLFLPPPISFIGSAVAAIFVPWVWTRPDR